MSTPPPSHGLQSPPTPAGPPPAAFGPPPGGYGPPADGYPAPAGGYGAPMGAPVPAPQAYAPPPAQAYAPPPGAQAPYGYGGMPPQPGPQAWPTGNPQAQGGLSCRFCGSVPAVEATIRGHQGFLVIMRFLKLRGPFCRDCGIASHRSMTAKSLWQGWWGIASAIINPITMLINLPQRAKINKLAPPLPGAPRQPMNPGRPVFGRPAVLGFLVPLLAIGLLLWPTPKSPDSAAVGDCVHNRASATVAGSTDDHPDVEVLPCSDPSADARVVGKVSGSGNPDDNCRSYQDSDGYYQHQGADSYTLCLHFLH
ncbi:hypothetical protein ABH930_005294 [Kitasatospora sp. GAS204A]|uniref:LppU/SCO3897 family protein n=1 Tax=unclassified Kitasatospora TaxID=2633591 RepID=UPI002476F4DA|nr:hypothetical protein [Kitasatospora sp. GAS204B]MDH6117849.1 hypothetical protein [Kitasatospora sp. GAS204B]